MPIRTFLTYPTGSVQKQKPTRLTEIGCLVEEGVIWTGLTVELWIEEGKGGTWSAGIWGGVQEGVGRTGKTCSSGVVEDWLGRTSLTDFGLSVELGVSLTEEAGLYCCGVGRTATSALFINYVDVGSETATLPVWKYIECEDQPGGLGAIIPKGNLRFLRGNRAAECCSITCRETD